MPANPDVVPPASAGCVIANVLGKVKASLLMLSSQALLQGVVDSKEVQFHDADGWLLSRGRTIAQLPHEIADCGLSRIVVPVPCTPMPGVVDAEQGVWRGRSLRRPRFQVARTLLAQLQIGEWHEIWG